MPFGETFVDMRKKEENWSTLYRFNGKEQDPESGLYYYGARYYNPRLGRFMSVDPQADSKENISYSPFNYVVNNPIRFIDPTGMTREEYDDYIFNLVMNDGSIQEIGRIVAPGDDVEFNISENVAKEYGIDNLTESDIDFHMNIPADEKINNVQAVSFNLSIQAAYYLGGQTEFSLLGMIEGPDKGEWAFLAQQNILGGYEAGITGSASFYSPVEGRDMALEDLNGLEIGAQGGAFMMTGSYFRGIKNYKTIYTGFSFGMSNPGVPTGSVYGGLGGTAVNSKWLKMNSKP